MKYADSEEKYENIIDDAINSAIANLNIDNINLTEEEIKKIREKLLNNNNIKKLLYKKGNDNNAKR